MANRYWVGGSGTWNSTSTANWSTSSGGASGASAPTTSDTVIFDNLSNSGTNSFTVTIGTSAACQSLTFGTGAQALDGAMTLAGTTGLTIAGSATLPASNLTITLTGVITFTATGTITSNGVSFNGGITFNGSAQTFTLGDALTTASGRTIQLTQGTLNLQTYTMTCGLFSSSNSSTRNITFGSGAKIVLTGSAATVWSTGTVTAMTITGTSRIEITANASTGTRTVTPGNFAEASALNFYITAGTDTISFTTGDSVKNLDFTGFGAGGTGTWASTSTTLYGNLTISSTTSITGGTATLTFSATSGTQTITSNGVTVDRNITSSGAGGTRALNGALTMGSARTLTIGAGTFDLSGYDVTTGLCIVSTNVTRTLAFGTKAIYINGTSGTVLNISNVTGFTYTGTSNFQITGAATTTRTITGASTGSTEALAMNVTVTAGTDTLTYGNDFLNLEFTSGFTGTLTLAAGGGIIYGNYIIGSSSVTTSDVNNVLTMGATSGTKTFNVPTGEVMNHQITFNGVGGTFQIVNSFSIGSSTARDFTHTGGTLDLNGKTITVFGTLQFSGSGVRQLNGPGTVATTLATVTTVINATTLTNFTVGGSATPTLELSGNAVALGTRSLSWGSSTGSESSAVNIKVSAGADTISFTTSSKPKGLEFTSGFTGTLNNTTITLYGGLTVSSGMSLTSGTNIMTFAATSGTYDITTNGVSVPFPLTFNGAGGTWRLQSALTVSNNRNFILTAGTLDANVYNISIATFSSSGSGVRQVNFGTGTWTITGSGASAWDCSTSTNMSTSIGSATISMTNSGSKTFAGGGLSYPTLNQGGSGTLTVSGSNTFANITNTVQPATVLFTSGTTQTFSAFSLSGTAGSLITIGSTTTSQHTLSKTSGTVSVSYCTISYSNATGGASWQAYTVNGNVDGGNNTGWLFAAVAGYNGYVGFFSFFN